MMADQNQDKQVSGLVLNEQRRINKLEEENERLKYRIKILEKSLREVATIAQEKME